MNDITNSPYLNKNDKNDNQDNEEDFSIIKPSKKDKKIGKFEKFKPKNNLGNKNEPSLRGAENKVKSILSSFLLTMESEDDRNNKKIRFLRDKLSTKKIKINGNNEKKNIKHFDNKKPLNSYFLNNLNNNNSSSYHEKSDSLLLSNEKRVHKDHLLLKKKISINYPKLKFSNLKIKNYNIYSKSSISNKNSELSNNGSSILSNENNKPNHQYIRKVNSYKKDKNKLFYKKNSVHFSKKKFCVDVQENRISDLERSSILNTNGKNSKFESSLKREDSAKSINPYIKKDIISKISNKFNFMNSNNKINKKISLNMDNISTFKKIINDSNFSSNISSSQIKDKDNGKSGHKRRFSYFKNKNDNNNQLQVVTVLKDLQEKIKNSIILRPEELVFNDEITHRRRKSIQRNANKIESKLSTKKNIYSYRLTNNKSQKDLINKDKGKKDFSLPLIYKKINKTWEEKNQVNKKKFPTKNNDLFKNNNISKNDTESDALKSGFQEDFSSNALPNTDNSLKNLYLEKYRILTHQNIIYDSLDDEENEDEVNDNFYLNPESNFILIFDFILLCVSLYSLISYPFYLAHTLTFCSETFFSIRRILNLFIELIYILDFIFGFFRAYYNFEEQLIKDNFAIIKKYLYGWFIFDFIGAIPVYSLIKLSERKCDNLMNASYYNHILNNINYLYLCNRLFKIIKSINYNQAFNFMSNKLNDNKYFSQISLLLQICFILSILNLSSCIYIFIGRNSYPNWIISTNLEFKNFSDIYICSIYILITALTTVGYGDITCYSFNERIFQLLLLIVGIVAYSWIISYISNYVKKINEKSIDFENRKSILDEIKINNPSLSNNLYERVLRHLKYKIFYENKDKSIIFECLPITLKNNLIAEMYKPIIKNFIFFKSFQNIDFIVRVILSFRPILAIKNDMLVNEGDFVEEIMFVKNGVLTVELPLNIQNPEENINKYINNPILQLKKNQEIGSSTTLPYTKGTDLKRSYNSNFSFNFQKTIQKNNIKRLKTKKAMKQIRYVKILNIRENEHFGDVLMFLEQRSPLCVRVRSKKAELFFLKKIDAISISSSYKNIWRRINKKSVFNFKQIKKTIFKIVELYCSYNKIKSEENFIKTKSIKKQRRNSMLFLKVKSNSFQLEKDIINIKKYNTQKNFKVHNEYTQYFDSDINDNSAELKVQSTKNVSNLSIVRQSNISCSLLNIFDIKNSDINKNNDLSNKNKSKSLFNITINNDKEINNKDNNDKDNNDKNDKTENEQLMNAYKGKYKFYEMNNIINTKTIIKEDIGNEESLAKRSTINRGLMLSNFVKNNTLNKSYNIDNIEENCIRENENEEEDQKKKEENSKNKNIDNKNSKKKSNKLNTSNDENLESDNIKIESYDGFEDLKRKYILNEDNNNNKCDVNEKSIINSSSAYGDDEHFSDNISNNITNYMPNNENIQYEINEEIYPGENLKNTKREENPLNNKESIIKFQKNEKTRINSNYFENSRLRLLLETNKNLQTYNEKQNFNNNYCKKKNNITDIIVNNNANSIFQKMKNNDKYINSTLSIESNIKIKILSIYENMNILSNYKFYKNKSLQLKIKNILEKEIQSEITSSSSSSLNIKKINENQNHNNSLKTFSNVSKIKVTKTVSAAKLESKRKSLNFNNNNLNGSIILTNHSKIKHNLSRKYTETIGMNKDIKSTFNKENKNKTIISHVFTKKKKKNSLWSRINTNIEKTNQNLNNPNEFYSNYFQSLLEGEKRSRRKIEKRRLSVFSNNIIYSPKASKLRREKSKGVKKEKSLLSDT